LEESVFAVSGWRGRMQGNFTANSVNVPYSRPALRARWSAVLVAAIAAGVMMLAPGRASAQCSPCNVTVASDSGTTSAGATGGSGTLSWAIAQLNSSSAAGQVINIETNVTLSGPLSPIFNSVTINGNGNTISGNNTQRIFMVGVDTATQQSAAVAGSIIAQTANVAINNVTLENGLARGGSGAAQAGGGLGAGGALFVNQSGNVTLSNVTFANNQAQGGAGGGSSGGEGGGGGGLGGGGGSNFGGGGGIFGSGGAGAGFGGGGGGIFGGGGANLGGAAGGGGGYSGDGGTNGGSGANGSLSIAGLSGSGGGAAAGGGGGSNGGGGGSTSLGLAGGGGGFGGSAGGGSGGAGGFGGGGGASTGGGGAGGFGSGGGGEGAGDGAGGFGGGGGTGGSGGFGGGGGSSGSGTAGGFGGGGGGGAHAAGSGGFGGGNGGALSSPGGGGGAAMGGAVFVVAGGSLSFTGNGTTSCTAGAGQCVTGGNGGTGLTKHNGGNGSAYGSGFFVEGSNVTFGNGTAGGAGTYTISDVIADLNGSAGNTTTSNGVGGTGGASSITVNQATLNLSAANTYTGGTTLTAGTINVGNNSALGSGALAMAAGTTLGFSASGLTIGNAITVSGDPTFVTTAPSSSPETISGTISNATTPAPVGAVVVDGGGYIALTGANTYSGGTTICGATADATCTNANGTTPTTLIVNNSTPGTSSSIGTGTLTFDGGTLQVATGAGPLSFSNAAAINATGGTIDTNGQRLTWTGTITGTGGLTVISSTGGGTLILTPATPGANTFIGATIVGDGTNAVTLQGGSANAFSTASAMTVNANATLDIGGYYQAVRSLAGGGTVTNNGGTGAVLGIVGGNSSTFAGTIKDGASTTGLTLVAGSTLILSGSNSYSGATNIGPDDTLDTLKGGAADAFSSKSAVTVGGRSTLDLGGFNQAIASLAGAGTVTNSGTSSPAVLTIAGGATTTFSGTIQNGTSTTGLTLSGAGTSLTLSGANTYSGGTTVDGGSTLDLTNNAGAGTGGITLQAGSTLGLNNVAITNTVGGSGDPNINVTGTSSMPTFTGTALTTFNILGTDNSATTDVLTVTTTNASYAGMTNVGGTAAGSSVTLKGGATNAFGSTSTVSIFTGSVLDLGGYNQAIGSLGGGGTVTNSGGSAGVLTTGGNNTSTTFSGVIEDGTNAMALTKTGTGTLTLTGANTYSGATTISGGTLEVDGSIANTSGVTVNAAGTLSGTGVIDPATTTIIGKLAPGNAANPTGMLTISGNLAFQSGALYVVQVTPSNAASVNVSGTAALTGATVNAQFAAGSYLTKQYTILTATGGLGGTAFAGLTNTSLPAGFTDSLSYNAADTDVFLNLTATLGAIGTGGLNTNQHNVANALDNFFNSGGALPASFVNVFGLTGAGLGNALSALSGEDATGAERAAFQLTNQFLGVMLDPFVNGRGNIGGGSSTGGSAIGFAPDEEQKLPADVALAYAAVLGKAPALSQPSPAGGGGSGWGFDQRWGAWGTAYGGSNTTSGDPSVGSHDVSAQTYGFAAGMDYHFAPHGIAGFALAGGGTNWGLSNALGSGYSQAFQFGGYGIEWFGRAYLGGALSFTNHWFTTDRAALGDELKANFVGQSYGARVEGGYRVPFSARGGGWGLGVTPYAAAQFQDFFTPGYGETDVTGGGFGLSYAAMNATDVRSELGSRFDDPTLLGGKPLILFGRLAWAHDFVSNPSLSAAFQALPGSSFTVFGAPIPHDSALTTAGARWFLTADWSLTAKFEGEFAAGSQTYAGTGTLRYTW